MISEIKRVKVLQAGNVGAALCGFIGVLLLPLALVVMIVDLTVGLSILLRAVLCPVLGFFGCIIAAALYNLAARMVGGLRFEHECLDDSREHAAVQDGSNETS